MMAIRGRTSKSLARIFKHSNGLGGVSFFSRFVWNGMKDHHGLERERGGDENRVTVALNYSYHYFKGYSISDHGRLKLFTSSEPKKGVVILPCHLFFSYTRKLLLVCRKGKKGLKSTLGEGLFVCLTNNIS